MNKLNISHVKIISIDLARKLSILVLFVLIFEALLFPIPTLANDSNYSSIDENLLARVSEKIITNVNYLPKNIDKKWKVIKTSSHYMTAYNSLEGQTDDTPCITANSFNVCEHGIEDTIAANFLKFGTKVRIPELFGDRIFIVRDRMNRRYTNRVDVWMLNRPDALTFGLKFAKIEILE